MVFLIPRNFHEVVLLFHFQLGVMTLGKFSQLIGGWVSVRHKTYAEHLLTWNWNIYRRNSAAGIGSPMVEEDV